MKRNRLIWLMSITITIAIMILGGCSQLSVPGENTNSTALTPVRVAVIPVLDTLPMYVAQKENLFDKYHVKVEFIPVGSAPERDQLIAAGQADAMVNEVLSTLFFNKENIQVQIVRYARTATSTAPLFKILGSAQSGITTPDGLKGVEIGIGPGTIIEYLTDRLLQTQGFTSDEIKTVSVPKIPDRMALLASGELKAAMLPDPLTFLAVQQGAVIVLDDSIIPEYAFSTIAFRKAFIDESPEIVRGFLAAIEDATDLINKNPDQYNSLLTEQKLVPAPILEAYKIGQYPKAGVPTQPQWDDVVNWAQDKGLLDVDVSYQDSVTDAYLP